MIENINNEWVKKYITQDKDMKELLYQAYALSFRPEPVLIQGESGTGKEIIARILHGERKGKFVALNTTAMPELLAESELFGHKKGSFTGAYATREGLIETAHNGTLFLDEIGDMQYSLQSKLLRILQERRYRRVGEDIDRHFDCRIISATNSSLSKDTFRRDLYYRLSVFELKPTPLRYRKSDIMLYLQTHLDAEDVEILSKRIVEKLDNKYELEGNYRELQNIVLRYQVFGLED